MILIADSGSSKTDWVLLKHEKVFLQLTSKGMNPFFLTSDKVFEVAKTTFALDFQVTKVSKIYFYGAGCLKGSNDTIISKGLNNLFTTAKIEVFDDMLGTARSLFGNKAGIACILGTGANSCKFDGEKIIEKIPALGYILGDEASGAYFGKILINNFFKKIMPDDLSDKFAVKFQPVESDILNKVYREPFPNRYLAQFAYFMTENFEHQYIKELLYKGINAFFESNILKYSDFRQYNVGFTGSLAFHFSEILNEVALKNKIFIEKVIEKPIDGLINYHLNRL